MIREPDEQGVLPREKPDDKGECRNCGQPVVGKYCHLCGQHTADYNHSLGKFILEFFGEFLQVDSKFIRTLVPLLIKPGYLTKEWVAGKRVRYITPLKLYITLSAICFLLISIKTPPSATIHVNTGDDQSLTAARQQVQRREKEASSWIERTFIEQVDKLALSGPEGDANRKEFSNLFIGRLSTANLVLLPIFALLFKLLYIRRSRFYVEHLVFALHYYSFFSIGASIVLVSPTAWITTPLILWMIAYLPVAMFVNYRQGILKTLFKCWIFCSAYLGAIAIVLLAMVAITAMELPASKPLASGQTTTPTPASPSVPKKP